MNDDPRFDTVWSDHRGYLLGLATRMLGERASAEDVVQEAFARLARVELDELDDVRGWLAVVVRRLCLDRVRSAYARRESVVGDGLNETSAPLQGVPAADPADRVTLDDQIRLALAVVLDRLTPAERTAFVLHDVFGLPFDAVGEIVGRTPTACRQLASRARRSIRSNEATPPRTEVEPTAPALLSERFIAACAGGDLGELMALLDPDVAGDATLLGFGPIVHAEGRPDIARRILALFGPPTDTVLAPFAVEGTAGFVAFVRGRFRAVVRLDAPGGPVRLIRAFVLPPR